MNEVTFTNFRGIDKLTIPLARAIMLMGPNGVGKTSILEGLYCLFSETRLDVMPLSRYSRRIGISNPHTGVSVGVTNHYSYNYDLFWHECPKYGNTSCNVSAQLNGLHWDWAYHRAKNLSELTPELASAANSPGWHIDALTEFAVWDWNIQDERHNRAQALSASMPGFHIFPSESKSQSFCRYIDFATIHAMPAKLTFKVSKMLTEALQLINPHVTDIRFEGADSGLSVILNDEYSTSLDTLGNGAVTLVNVLIAIFETLETQSRTMPDAPLFVLIDEIGAAMHHNVMLDVWKYLKLLSEKHHSIHYVATSHNNECVDAFCEVFRDRMVNNEAKLLRLHNEKTELVVTEEIRS